MIKGNESSNASIEFITHQYLLQILEKNKYEQQNKTERNCSLQIVKINHWAYKTQDIFADWPIFYSLKSSFEFKFYKNGWTVSWIKYSLTYR